MASIMELWEEWDKAWNAHDAGKIASCVAADCTWDTPLEVLKGRDAVKAYAEGIFSAFPDVKLEARTQVASGNLVAGEVLMTGTHKGPLSDGTPATGKSFSLKFCGFIEFEGNLMKRLSTYFDTATLMRQLGLIPPAPG